jgi:hypothetical protein
MTDSAPMYLETGTVTKMRYYHGHLRVQHIGNLGKHWQCRLSYVGSGLGEGSTPRLKYTDRITGAVIESVVMDPRADCRESVENTNALFKDSFEYSIEGPNPLYIRGEIRATYSVTESAGLFGLRLPYETDQATFVVDLSQSGFALPRDAKAGLVHAKHGLRPLPKPVFACAGGATWVISAAGVAADSSLVVGWGDYAPTGAEVFISYSHLDQEWLDHFRAALHSYVRGKGIKPWDDTKIKPGSDWRKEIQNALDRARVAILLVSQNFLDSPFIRDNELPPLLDAARERNLVIFWIPVDACEYATASFAKYQPAHDPTRPLARLGVHEVRRATDEIRSKLLRVIDSVASGSNV